MPVTGLTAAPAGRALRSEVPPGAGDAREGGGPEKHCQALLGSLVSFCPWPGLFRPPSRSSTVITDYNSVSVISKLQGSLQTQSSFSLLTYWAVKLNQHEAL